MPLLRMFAQILAVSTQLDKAVGEVVGKGEGDAGDSYRWRIIAFNSFIPSSIPCIRISLASIFATRALIPSSIPSIRTSQDMVGDAEGNAVGEVVGNVVGKVEGEVVGNVVGKVEGDAVGEVVGNVVG